MHIPNIEAECIAVHKRSIIRYLRQNPEAFPGIVVNFTGSLGDYIAALEADPRSWLIDGRLSTEEEVNLAFGRGAS